ncbi:MAG: citrate (Si)-synthase [Myxococcales bacterium]|nr:citrate (Si)-synthase [Myxococcales bacterium]
MSDELLPFTITAELLDTGMRGFPVSTVYTSEVDPGEGLHYVGYPIADLANLDPEAAIYLLFYKKIPNRAELARFKKELRKRAKVDKRVIKLITGLPKAGHPMEWLIAGLTFAGMLGKTNDYREDALNVVAQMPEIVAAIYRTRSGWGKPVKSKPQLGLVENFVRMLGVPDADPERLTRLLRVFYVLHMDHGGGNLSTFVGKAVASGKADTYASLGASMAGLYGPLHGRANQECLEFLEKSGTNDPDMIEQFIRDEFAAGRSIFGFGHAVLRAEDPRAGVQYELGKELCPGDALFKRAIVMRERAVKVLKANPKVKNPYPNVDAVSGTLLRACGLADSEYYTVLFGLARCSGIAAQIVDERLVHRNGKGVPIYRPSDIPVNQPRRRYKARK